MPRKENSMSPDLHSKAPENREKHPSENLQFALTFAVRSGHFMMAQRNNLAVSKKLDRTDVSNVDIAVNRDFERAVSVLSGGRASVTGEESSSRVTDSEDEWIIDPVDGTGEYIDGTVPDSERTSCVAIALFKSGVLRLSVVYNPFKDELFYADKDLGGAFLNDRRLDLNKNQNRYSFSPGISYDFCHWDSAQTDARFFESMLERAPIGSYSAIYQACMVAKGESAFAVFPGNTIHDIAPAALLVEMSGGVTSAIDDTTLDMNNLNGAVYSNNNILHSDVVRALNGIV